MAKGNKLISWVKVKYLRALQDRLLFVPEHHSIEVMGGLHLHEHLDEMAAMSCRTGDNVEIKIDYLEARDESRPVFVLFHGNTGHWEDVGADRKENTPEYDRQYRLKLLQELAKTASGIIAVSMRGYGNSQKAAPSEVGFAEDVKAVVEFVLNKVGIPQRKIVLMGESLGAAIALMAAEEMTRQKKPPPQLVMIAPFASVIEQTIQLHPDLPRKWVEKHVYHPFRSDRRIKKLSKKTHVLIIHPKNDETIKPRQSRILEKAALAAGVNVSRILLPGAGHVTWPANVVVAKALKAFNKGAKKK